MPMPFYGRKKMEINYRNGFLFGVKLLKKKIVVKRLRLFHNPPPNTRFMNY